jgi:hypothetical protein
MHEKERRSLATAASAAQPVGAYVAKALDPVARTRGFATTALLSEWPAIVGQELAQFTMPDRVVWPMRRKDEAANNTPTRRAEGATLVLRVEGARGIEVQHRAGQILERVNLYFGYRAVTEMRILQAPVRRAAPRPVVPPQAEIAEFPAASAIDDARLRRALGRLGTAARARLTRG